MGIFIFVCSLFCLIYAVDKYYTAVKLAEAISQRMPGFALESTRIPIVSIVSGTVGVMLLVASLILIVNSFRAVDSELLGNADS